MNLVQRFVAQARGGEPLTVTRGQYLNPTSVQDIVPAILSLLDRSVAGLFHLAGEGACTAREFATAVLELAGLPIRIRELDRDPRPTIRARYPVLKNRRLAEAGLPPLPPWRVSLAHYVSRLTGRELG
jgi:dTDP-4-dehydrorhamnose reductase